MNADQLYEEALKLPLEEQITLARRLLATVDFGAHGHQTSWETLNELRGIVHLGGNAVEDCGRLYDG